MKKHQDTEWLYQKYWEEELDMRDMAELAGVCPTIIRKWMVKLGIKRRSQAESCRTSRAKQKRSLAQRKAWKQPGAREKRIQALKDQWANPEYRRKVIEGLRRAWQDEESGWHSEEYRNRMSEVMKASWDSGNLDVLKSDWWRQKKTKDTKALWENGVYDGVFSSPSKLSILVGETFEDFGFVAELEFYVNGRPFDIFVPELNLLVEVDGEYWHHSEWAIKEGQPERDHKKEELALMNGFVFARIRERDIEALGVEEMVGQVLREIVQ